MRLSSGDAALRQPQNGDAVRLREHLSQLDDVAVRIAAELYLPRRTVQTHVSNILNKLQLHSRVEVVRALAEHGGTVPVTAATK